MLSLDNRIFNKSVRRRHGLLCRVLEYDQQLTNAEYFVGVTRLNKKSIAAGVDSCCLNQLDLVLEYYGVSIIGWSKLIGLAQNAHFFAITQGNGRAKIIKLNESGRILSSEFARNR